MPSSASFAPWPEVTSEEVARGTVRDVRRVIENILKGESYRPRLLYRLKDTRRSDGCLQVLPSLHGRR